MSANLVVDLGNTCQIGWSIPDQANLSPSGQVCGLSGLTPGKTVDMLHADTYCNLLVVGQAVLASGPLVIQVQCSDDNSTWFDPTSGYAAFPGAFTSGTLLTLNSGSAGGTFGAAVSGHMVLSGFAEAQGFQRTGRFVRANMLGSGGVASGLFIGNLAVGFVSQYRTTGSGGGFAYSPTSGTVNV